MSFRNTFHDFRTMGVTVHCRPGTYGREEIYLFGSIVKTSYKHFLPIHTIQVKAAGNREDEIWPDLMHPRYVTAHPGSEFLECTGNTDAPSKKELHLRTDLFDYTINRVNTDLKGFNHHARMKERRMLEQGYLDEYELADPGKEFYEQNLPLW